MRYNTVNEKFFDAWSSNMAYVLGYFIGDGCLCWYANKYGEGSYKIAFYGAAKKSDRDLLLQIRDVMESTAKVRRIKNTYELCLASKHMHNQLRKLGKRTRPEPMGWPKVPKKYMRDFIRGYIDADGCICTFIDTHKRKLSTGKVVVRKYRLTAIRLSSPDRRLVQNVYRTLRTVLRLPTRKLCASHGGFPGSRPQYQFTYRSEPAKKILRWLYYPGCLCLSRKGRMAEPGLLH